MTFTRPTFVFLILGAILSVGASCGGGETQSDNRQGSGGEATEAPRVTELEQVNAEELTRSERRVWVELINSELSPCGDPISVGRCVAEGGDCRRCVPAANYLLRLLAEEGLEREEIEERYQMRYGRNSSVEIDIEGAPVRGAAMAPITIVEFSDFECPYCGRAHPIVQQVLREFEGRVRVVFKHYPLSGHQHAMPAARAAIAAGNQGHFWEMHDLLFEHQRQLEEEHLEGYAEQLGLDMERFRRDLLSSETQRRVEADREAGSRVEITGTPSFFVNGRRFRDPPSSLVDYIREELDE